MPNLYQSSWEKLSEKNWNNHIWPFLIYTSPFGKNCQKKIGTTNLAIPNLHQSFWETLSIPILAIPNLYQSFGKREQTFLAIPNLYQSFWEKLLEKIGTTIFGHSKFIPVSQKKFGHFLGKPVFLGKIVRKKLESIWPFQILYQSISEKDWPFQIYTSPFGKHCPKKIGTSNFGHSKFIPVLLGNIVGKRLEQTFLAIPNLYQSFWEKLLKKFGPKFCWKKFGTTIFGHSKFIPVFLGNIVRKRLEQTFLAIPNLYQSFWEKLLEKFGTTIFGHSKFIPVFLGKIVGKKFKWPFLAIPNLYQSS